MMWGQKHFLNNPKYFQENFETNFKILLECIHSTPFSEDPQNIECYIVGELSRFKKKGLEAEGNAGMVLLTKLRTKYVQNQNSHN